MAGAYENDQVTLDEQAAADTPAAGQGRIWLENSTPNKLKFTNDVGDTTDLGGSTLGTEQASTSGTAIDFTGIPSGVSQITIMFVSVSTSGVSDLMVQIGDAGGIETSGYLSLSSDTASSNELQTAGFQVYVNPAATHTIQGNITLELENDAAFTWTEGAILGNTAAASDMRLAAGSKSLSAELTQLRITTVNGTDTFDNGVINIKYQ